jgi:hypothetical protein
MHLRSAVTRVTAAFAFGLLLAPLAVTLLPAWRRRAALWCVALAGAAVALYAREGALMFYLTNVLYDFGVGALSLRDTLYLGHAPPVRLGTAFRVLLTVVATASAALLGGLWAAGWRRLREPVTALLLLALGLLFAGSLLHTRYFFDRYLLVIVPFAIAVTVRLWPTPRVGVLPTVLLLLLAWYAVAGTHDYLAWNRARQRGLDALLADGVPPTQIDGGVEFNGWHLAATLDRWPSDADVRIGDDSRPSWWWVVDDRFVVSFAPLRGYAEWRALPYRRWLVPGAGHVYVLQRAHD